MNITRSDLILGVELAQRHLDSKCALISNGDLTRVVTKTGLLINSRPLTTLTEVQSHVFQMSLEYARRAEVHAAGSAFATLEYAKHLLINSHDKQSEVKGVVFKQTDLRDLLHGVISESELEILLQFVELAGASRYVVEHIPSRFNSVEFVDNYEFIHVSKSVINTVNMDDSRVLIADAYIESEAEIRKLLEWCGKEKERLLLCCRGFSDDVLHTLAINRARGTLAAYAIAIPFTESDANTLVDIATILGSDVISSLKGQLISTVEPSSLPRAKYARLHDNVLEINDPLARSRVERLIINIKDKLETCEIQVRDYLEKRLKRLMGATMIVRLQSGIDHSYRCEQWDLALRTIHAAIRGVMIVEDKQAWPSRKLIPLLSEATACEYAAKLTNNLQNLAAII